MWLLCKSLPSQGQRQRLSLGYKRTCVSEHVERLTLVHDGRPTQDLRQLFVSCVFGQTCSEKKNLHPDLVFHINVSTEF